MTKPTLEEVKEYFKNASKIKDIDGDIISMDNIDYRGIHEYLGEYYVCHDSLFGNNVFVWHTENGYSEILEYKENYNHTKTDKLKDINVKFEELKPKHYKSREVNGMDVIDLVKHWSLNFNEGNILKYLLRDKGEDKSDLKKIIQYAKRELNHIDNV